ncbi:MAG: hypothetical protein ACLGHY_13440, partial [Gammaproteobacteria bacterium]
MVVAALHRGLSYAEAELGNVEQGLVLLNLAIANSHALSDTERGKLFSQRGLIRIRLGDVRGSLGDYATAEPLVRGDAEELARLALNRGNIHLDQGHVAAAIADYTTALQQYERVHRPDGAAKAIGNLGY